MVTRKPVTGLLVCTVTVFCVQVATELSSMLPSR
jgi:hypothetical protein